VFDHYSYCNDVTRTKFRGELGILIKFVSKIHMHLKGWRQWREEKRSEEKKEKR
jgi:hypothetical protein